MNTPRIGIIIGTTREGRFGEVPAHCPQDIGNQRRNIAFGPKRPSMRAAHAISFA